MYAAPITAAVQRKYESMRRLWKSEDKEDFVEMNQKIALMKKYRARRKRVSFHSWGYLFIALFFYYVQKFENRAVVVKESEIKYWKDLSLEYMSEESDDPGDLNTLVVHKLLWCSQGLFYVNAIGCMYNASVV